LARDHIAARETRKVVRGLTQLSGKLQRPVSQIVDVIDPLLGLHVELKTPYKTKKENKMTINHRGNENRLAGGWVATNGRRC
jgi:hypothetical protein